LSPLEQVQLAALKRGIENEVAKARESITVAESELKRVQDLHQQKLRGQQDVEQARGRLNLAKADLDSAVDKGKLFAVSAKGNGMAQLPTLSLEAPRAATVLLAHVSPGQYVQAAAPLVTLADLSQLWVRVPIPEHDLPRVDRQKPATVALKTAGPRTKGRKDQTDAQRTFPAQPVALVPQVDMARHTADLIYELPEASQKVLFAKDQMVTAFVPLGKETEQTVVPYAALIFDAYGGTWIYLDQTPEKATELVFERRRVELGPTVENGVVVRPAFKGHERVVVAGAAALFSREFHKPPVKVGEMSTVDDDDD
jgi:multidrug efflux pump subunit AcrA (membrane-fusion protein)